MAEGSKLRRHRYLLLSMPVLTILLLVLLYVLYPHTWRPYITYVIARLGSPLISLFLALAVLALLLSAFLKYRRKSSLIAACLTISIALHLIAISVFSLWVIKQAMYELVREAGKYDLSLGLPSLVESMVSQAVRDKLLEPSLADTRQFEAKKTSKIEPAEMATGKAQPHVPKTPLLSPTREQIELEQIIKPAQKLEEKLEKPPEKPPEVDIVEISKLKPVEVERKDEKLDESLTKPLEVKPVPADKPLPEAGQLPPQAELSEGSYGKETVRPPTRQAIELLAERVTAHKVEDMIQTVEITKTLDRLKLPAQEVPVETKPLKTEGKTVSEPTATFRLSRPTTETAETPSPRVKLPEIANASAKMATLIVPGKDESVQPESETPKVQEQLAIRVGDQLLDRPIVNVGRSTALVQTGRKKTAVPSAESYGRVELAAVRPEAPIEEAAVAFTPQPEKGAKLDVTASHLSLMDEATLVEPSQTRTTIAKDSVIQTATGKAFEPADVEIVAGSLHMTRESRPMVETKGGGETTHELHGMEVTKALPPTEPDVSMPAYAQPTVQCKVPVQTGKLAETDVRPLAEAKKPSSVKEARLVTVSAVTKTPEPMSLTIAAQAAKRGQDADNIPAATALSSVTAIQATKVTVAEEPTEVEFTQGRGISRGSFGEGGTTGADRVDRPPERIQPEVSGIKEATVEVPAELSAAISTGEIHQSLISVEAVSPPEILSKKAIYKLRTSENRKRFIEELGGTPGTEEAVEKALVWLAKAQSDDGRWDVDEFKLLNECGGAGDQKDGDVAVTGLSLLAYLGAGYTHTRGDYQEPIRKALEWLVAGQTADGDLRRGGQMYGQAMATAALCEAYSMTHDAWLLPAAQCAVKFILDAQNPGAGWRYQPRDDSDTSVVGWQVLALKSAEIAGIKIPNQHYVWTGVWIDSVRKGKDGGLYSYKPGHAVTPTMTAEGWFCQLFINEEAKTRGITESIDYIMKNLPQWAPDSDTVPHLYYWYYATLSLYLAGAKEFDVWNAALSKALLKGRVKDGAAAGSWDPVCQLGPRGGRIYSTAMATLCLEVYYRYLPFYKQK